MWQCGIGTFVSSKVHTPRGMSPDDPYTCNKKFLYFKISLSKRDKRKSEIYHRVASEERKSVLSIVMGIVIPTMLAQDRPSMSCSGVG